MKTMTAEAFLDAYAAGELDFQNVDLSHVRLPNADLSGANFTGANFTGADLSGAYLYSVNLREANMSGANMSGAYLCDACLSGADLFLANLTRADLRGANLTRADLTRANLTRANLSGARLSGARNLAPATAAQLMRCPPVDEFVAYKKCAGGAIVKLLVPADAKRSSATGSKCRASHVIVLEGEGTSYYDPNTRYHPGARVECNRWGEDRWVECAGGIHFFMTREEAEAYQP